MSTWGVDNALPAATISTAGGDVACAAGTETNVLSSTLTVNSTSINTILFAMFSGVVVLGATPPTALVIAIRLGAGADFDTYTVNPAALVANAVLNLNCLLAGNINRGQLAGGGAYNITVNATGQAVTLKANARAVFFFMPGPDL